MRIVVCIKQVPDSVEIKWTEQNTMIRDSVNSVINPYDQYALETALRIKDNEKDVHITAVSMGPLQAKQVLKKAIALGVDEAVLISDRLFSGSDTIATSRTIAAAIKKISPQIDLVLCGQFAIDGDTAQTGPGIAEFLDMSQITFVKEIENINGQTIIVKKQVEDGLERIQSNLPTVLCMLKTNYELRNVSIQGIMRSNKYEYKILSMNDIDLQREQVGLAGSNTCVVKAFKPPARCDGILLNSSDTNEVINGIKKYFIENKIIL